MVAKDDDLDRCVGAGAADIEGLLAKPLARNQAGCQGGERMANERRTRANEADLRLASLGCASEGATVNPKP